MELLKIGGVTINFDLVVALVEANGTYRPAVGRGGRDGRHLRVEFAGGGAVCLDDEDAEALRGYARGRSTILVPAPRDVEANPGRFAVPERLRPSEPSSSSPAP